MKATENILWQGLILSLTAQLAWSLVADNHAPRSPSAASASNQGIIGTLHRSAAIKATPEQETSLAQSARGQRCVRCGTSGYYGGNNVGYADRYYDDYYYRDRGAYSGAYGREEQYRDPYYQQQRDRWYYQPEYRNPYDRKSSDGRDDELKNFSSRSYTRYDDRSYGREDPYYNREQQPVPDQRYNANYNSYRGNGYDNLNPTHYEAMRERFQRDRGYGYDQYYDRDRFYDRPGYRSTGGGSYYDNRNFRPYDETYRGSAGFDNSGRGYYFASQDGVHPNRLPPYRHPPYDQAQSPPSHSSHYNPPQSQSQHTTPKVPPEFYQGKPSQAQSTLVQVQTVSSGAIGTVDSNSATNNKNSNKEIDDKEKQSSTYGRPSLGTSYLFERTDEDGNAAAMNPPSASKDDKKPESEMKSA